MLDHKPVIGKDGKPVTEISVENVFLYAPTRPDMVCFDGWRPLETQPGETGRDLFIKEWMNKMYGKFGMPPLVELDAEPPRD